MHGFDRYRLSHNRVPSRGWRLVSQEFAATAVSPLYLSYVKESMQYYQHQFDQVEDYLHHRPPYLLVQDIESIAATEIITRTTLSGDEFFIAGHFPGAPILPGAMMQEITTQTGGILIAAKYNPMQEYNTHDPFFNEFALGVLVKVTHARYRGFARPGDSLTIRVQLNETVGEMFDFSGSVAVKEKVIMRNTFRLTNIRSRVLQGNPESKDAQSSGKS